MPWNRKTTGEPDDAVEVVYDDGGSGLFDACVARFASYGCVVRCDSRSTVWISNSDGSYTVGLAMWLLERRSMPRILDDVEAKLREHRAEKPLLSSTAP